MSADADFRLAVGREAGLPERVEIYDTTLRDGSQLEGISLTVDDKLRIAEQLDWLGVDYIEAGYPGANPKDDEVFRRAASELTLTHSTLVRSAPRAGRRAGSTPTTRCATSSRPASRRSASSASVGTTT
ncbi:MAG TPA: hypothetical protein VFC99_18810 [Acidimicrobiia bacterium]|nr:hypothetical protein [Acidimicrobiia bacterium]